MYLQRVGWACAALLVTSGAVGGKAVSKAAPDQQTVDVEGPTGEDVEKAPARLPAFQVLIDKAKVDLDKHRLELRMNRKAGRVVLKVLDEFGAPLAEQDKSFKGKPPGATLVVPWAPTGDDKVGRIEVYAYDAYGFYKAVALVPWFFEVPHEEVNFETNSDVIRPSEAGKLDSSLTNIRALLEERKALGKISLFIAGHTDTRGKTGHNAELSRRRARAIALWFKAQNLETTIAYEGFGEASPLVKTADEVDEPKNRRVDYVLAVEEPLYKNSQRRPAWKKP